MVKRVPRGHRNLALLLTVVVLLLLSCFAAGHLERTVSTTIIRPVQLLGQQPAGEITTGFTIRQEVPPPGENNPSRKQFLQTHGPVNLCLKILMANYSNRKNQGIIRVSLTQKNLEVSRDISVDTIRDNAFHMVRFQLKDPSELNLKGSLVLKIAGVKGEPGSSVTVWLTDDLNRGEAFINGISSKKALRFCLFLEQKNQEIWYPALTLFVIYAGIFYLLISQAVEIWTNPRTGKPPDQQALHQEQNQR